MKTYLRLLLYALLPIAIGCLLFLPVVNSENGYVAGFVYFPLLLLIVFIAAGLFVLGLIATGMKGRPGLWLLASGPALFAGFFGLALIAKQFELGAYREEPTVPIPPPIADKVLFKKEATHDQIEAFWTDVIGYRTGQSGHWSRPGVQSGARTLPEDGHETITFSFRPEATEEQKADIRERINAYSPVFKYLEDVPTEAPTASPATDSNNSKVPQKKGDAYIFRQ